MALLPFSNAPGSGSGITGTFHQETLSGTINGTNKAFTAAHTPGLIVLEGQLQVLSVDYTVSTLTVTFTNAPTDTGNPPINIYLT
jgi:hypothetical protein